MRSVAEAIRGSLLSGEARDKVMAARAVARSWRKGDLAWAFDVAMPERPAWPTALELLPANRMPRRGAGGSQRNAVALWHSLAHIEFVAIDLALDMAGRFGAGMSRTFVGDFLSIAADEAMHFALIARKLERWDRTTGRFPRIPASGKLHTRPATTSRRGWLSSRWSSRRVDST